MWYRSRPWMTSHAYLWSFLWMSVQSAILKIKTWSTFHKNNEIFLSFLMTSFNTKYNFLEMSLRYLFLIFLFLWYILNIKLIQFYTMIKTIPMDIPLNGNSFSRPTNEVIQSSFLSNFRYNDKLVRL